MQQPPRPPFTSAGQAGVAPPGMVVLNNVQLMRPGALGPQRSVATVSPRVLVGNPVQRPVIPQQILNTMQGSSQGHLLLKTDGGQYQLLRVGQGPVAALNTQPGRPTTTAGIAGASPLGQSADAMVPTPLIEAQMANQTTQQQMMAHELPPLEPLSVPIASISSMPTPQLGYSQANQKTIRPPENSNHKCRNFLANLLDLSTKEPPSVEASVKNLIQELINGGVESNTFCDRLERLLNASPQPCLIGFLKKSLPALRQSLVLGELVIQGIAAPPYRVAFPPSAVAQSTSVLAAPNLLNVRMPPTNMQVASGSGIGMAHTRLPNKPAGGGKSWTINKQATTLRPQAASSTIIAPGKSLFKEGKKASFQIAFSEDKMAGDDDINDVAAMGGVNLQEETRRILGNTDLIGSQIRSCKDESLVPSAGLQARIRMHCEVRGLDEPPPEVAQLMSHALQERMKSIFERLTTNMMHRLDTECKNDGLYEVSHDVKGKLKFLEDLDRVEKKRREDSERELLLRAAKSRSKTEDPEQAKLKAKAKEMQRAEMEEVRQREANLTALQAIGPRKRARLDTPQDAAPPAQPQPSEGKKASFQIAFSEDKMAGDDDINDVAAMGGVNLQEETRRILGNTDLIGSQIRSCKDESLVPSAGLQARIRMHCEVRGLDEPPLEVAQLMSHALQERMKSIFERLTTNMMHRLDTECKNDGLYEVSHDVKGKLKFLEDLDRVEKKRREDSERELLLRAAKSRSKTEDPEQAKLKAKAKEMQRAEMEEVRQREANLTALQAIGPRKRARLDTPQDAAPPAQPQPSVRPGGPSRLRTRMRRITLRDMLHLLENDRIYARSSILYKAYLKP